MKRIAVFSFLLAAVACTLPERKQVWVVGSSTLYPFIAAAAEQFGRATEHYTPIVESTGTGGGLKLFCGGVGLKHPDIANASRRIKDKETALCAANGVKEVAEFAIGFDGIVLANLKSSPHFVLTREQIFKALAKELPGEGGKLTPNPYKKWSEIDPALPEVRIEVYGPPPTSGTRDAFAELAMEHSCKNLPAFAAAWPDEDRRKEKCRLLREDGVFIDAGENDNIIVQKLQNNPTALGIFGFSFLEQNLDTLQGSTVEDHEPEFTHIADGSYPLSRSLYIYVKKEHATLVPGLKAFVEEVLSEHASGGEGYLAYKGLIPSPELSRNLNRQAASDL